MTLSFDFLDRRPLVIAIAGSNGAGKSTFYASHLADSGLRFVNADVLAAELAIGAYDAAEMTAALRSALVQRGESFIFETVLSDPVGEKVDQLASYVQLGYEVALIFVYLNDSQTSVERVSVRVSQGGHDIPDEKLLARFERTQTNLQRAIERLPHVLIYDNSDLDQPFRFLEQYLGGKRIEP